METINTIMIFLTLLVAGYGALIAHRSYYGRAPKCRVLGMDKQTGNVVITIQIENRYDRYISVAEYELASGSKGKTGPYGRIEAKHDGNIPITLPEYEGDNPKAKIKRIGRYIYAIKIS